MPMNGGRPNDTRRDGSFADNLGVRHTPEKMRSRRGKRKRGGMASRKQREFDTRHHR